MAGDHSVAELRQRRAAGEMPVEPECQPTAHSRSIGYHPGNCFCAARHSAVRLDQTDGRLKTLRRYILGKASTDSLKRGDINRVVYRLLPPPYPTDTKIAVPVIDQERLLGRRGTTDQSVWATHQCQFRQRTSFEICLTLAAMAAPSFRCASGVKCKPSRPSVEIAAPAFKNSAPPILATAS